MITLIAIILVYVVLAFLGICKVFFKFMFMILTAPVYILFHKVNFNDSPRFKAVSLLEQINSKLR